MKTTLISSLLFFASFLAKGQSYKEWDEHDVIRFYERVELESYSLNADGEEIDEVYVPAKVDDGRYKVEVYKVSSNLYRITGTNYYMFFRYSPYLYSGDEGVLEVSYSSGTFYEEP